MKKLKLYNVFFPIWLIFLFPPIIFVVLIVNFVVDSLVVKLTLKKMGYENKDAIYKKTVLKTYGIGFLADLIGAVLLLGLLIVFGDFESLDSFLEALVFNPFTHPLAFIVVAFGVFISAVFIYFFNLITFEGTELKEEQRKKIAMNLAIYTAPYFFLLPLSLFMN